MSCHKLILKFLNRKRFESHNLGESNPGAKSPYRSLRWGLIVSTLQARGCLFSIAASCSSAAHGVGAPLGSQTLQTTKAIRYWLERARWSARACRKRRRAFGRRLPTEGQQDLRLRCTFPQRSVWRVDRVRYKGVYHINALDEVTQWKVMGSVEQISEAFLGKGGTSYRVTGGRCRSCARSRLTSNAKCD
jgi:hypothetical protein